MTQTAIINHMDSTYCVKFIIDRLKVKFIAKAVSHFCKANKDVDPECATWKATSAFYGKELLVGRDFIDYRNMSSQQVYDLLIKHLTVNKSGILYTKY